MAQERVPSERTTRDLKLRGAKSSNLSKLIFSASLPEKFIREIPAQSLYMAIKENGLLSSADLIEMASIEQCRLLLDFDCWKKDEFDEDAFWDWLALTDENDDLSILQKLIKFVDLKLIALLIDRYVTIHIFEDQTEASPGEGYYTPDNGFTWVLITQPDGTKHFLLGRLLALIFETDAELFYQIISIPKVATSSMLEDESYVDRNRRLSAEGVPDSELAAKIHTPLVPGDFSKILTTRVAAIAVEDIRIVDPVVYDNGFPDALRELVKTLDSSLLDEFEAELTLITNAAFVFFHTDFNHMTDTVDVIETVKGALCIGIEKAQLLTALSPHDIYTRTKLQPLYQLGLFELSDLKRTATKIPDETAKRVVHDTRLFSVLAGARERIPRAPMWFNSDEEASDENKLEAKFRPIRSLSELQALKNYISDQISTYQN